VAENLIIRNNTHLVTLQGLDHLTRVGAILEILNNSRLTTLDGLVSLMQVEGNLIIRSNSQLASIEGLNALLEVSGRREIDLTEDRLEPSDGSGDDGPIQAIEIIGEGVESGWRLEGAEPAKLDPVSSSRAYAGETALELQAGFRIVRLYPPQPLATEDFTALRFAFHPADATAPPIGGQFQVHISSSGLSVELIR